MPKCRSSVCVALSVALVALVSAPLAHAQATPDCTGPASDPAPGSAAWHQREQDNDYCGEQRFYDTSANPLFVAGAAAVAPREEDPFRDPARWNGTRGRYQPIEFLHGALFRPLAAAPPYPGILIVHGGGARQEMYLWAAEGLAEAGYMVMTFQVPEPDNTGGDAHYPDAKDALDWFLSPGNPLAGELDHDRIGLAGHSAGGVAVSRLGQEDPRVEAIVSWDRAKSTPMP